MNGNALAFRRRELLFILCSRSKLLRPHEYDGSHPFNFAVSLLSSPPFRLLEHRLQSVLPRSSSAFDHLHLRRVAFRLPSFVLISPPFILRLIQPRGSPKSPRRIAWPIASSLAPGPIVSRSATF